MSPKPTYRGRKKKKKKFSIFYKYFIIEPILITQTCLSEAAKKTNSSLNGRAVKEKITFWNLFFQRS